MKQDRSLSPAAIKVVKEKLAANASRGLLRRLNFLATDAAMHPNVSSARDSLRFLGRIAPPALVIAAILSVQYLLPFASPIQIGGDEGLELAKTALVVRGYALYSGVWSDQPPLHTYVLSGVLTRISPSISAGRLLTTLYALCLLAAMSVTSFRRGGVLVAITTTLLLVMSPGFLGLGNSVMLEIPALTPAVLALVLLAAVPTKNKRMAEATAGALFGIALLTKLVVVVLLPLAVLIILLKETELTHRAGLPAVTRGTALRMILGSTCILMVAAATTFVGLDLLLERGAYLRHFSQSWTSHFGAAKLSEYGSPNDYPFDWSVLLKHWDTALPALVGVIVCLFRARQDPMHILPPAWLVLSLFVFGLHRPWWTYYYVHTAIPLCWCAGIGLGAVWNAAFRSVHVSGTATADRRWRSKEKPKPHLLSGLLRPWTTALLALYLLCAVPWIIGRMYVQITTIRNSPQTYNSPVLAEMARYKPYTQWLYTDDPIYSFHSGILLPPDLAVVMLKRFWSGEMTNARLAAEVREYAPGLILLRKPAAETPLDDLIRCDYRLVYYDNDHHLYAHKSISEKLSL